LTEDGTLADELLALRATKTPSAPAGPLNVTVPVEVAPPVTVLGLNAIDRSSKGETESVAACDEPEALAVMVTVEAAVTELVVTVNVAVVAPAATVTDFGTVAMLLLEDKLTTSPPAVAAPDKVKVPVDVSPPTRVFGFRVRLLMAPTVTVNDAVTFTPPEEAVIMAEEVLLATRVLIVNDAVVDPPGTITNAGTNTDASLLTRLTTSPPAGADVERVTVPVELAPPATVVGLIASLLTGTVLTSVPIA